MDNNELVNETVYLEPERLEIILHNFTQENPLSDAILNLQVSYTRILLKAQEITTELAALKKNSE